MRKCLQLFLGSKHIGVDICLPSLQPPNYAYSCERVILRFHISTELKALNATKYSECVVHCSIAHTEEVAADFTF